MLDIPPYLWQDKWGNLGYSAYHALCWAEGETDTAIRAEIARCEHKARTHHYQWNEVGCTTWDWQRVDTLTAILENR